MIKKCSWGKYFFLKMKSRFIDFCRNRTFSSKHFGLSKFHYCQCSYDKDFFSTAAVFSLNHVV